MTLPYPLKRLVMSFLVGLIVMHCSRSGSDRTSEKPEDPKDPPIPLEKVTAKIFENQAGTPATDYVVVVQDLADGSVQMSSIDAAGELTMAITMFKKNRSYSMYILDSQYNFMSPIYFEGASDFRWNGERGFTLGELLIYRDGFGLVDLTRSNVSAQSSGAITPVVGSDTDLGQTAVTPASSIVTFGHELLAFQPSGSLFGHYLRASYPKVHAAEHLEHSRAFIQVLGGQVTGSSLHAAGSWIQSARWAASDDSSRTGSPSWRIENGHGLVETTAGVWQAHAFPGYSLQAGAVAIVSLASSKAATLVGRRLSHQISLPPLVYAIGQNASPTTINYANLAAENGLTNPFCRTSGDVSLTMDRPLNMAGEALTAADMAEVIVELRYYTRPAAGAEAASPVASSDFGSGFSAAFEEDIAGVGAMKWEPSTSRLTYDISVQSTARVSILIPSEIMLATIASLELDATRVELRIVFAGSGSRAGNIVIFRAC